LLVGISLNWEDNGFSSVGAILLVVVILTGVGGGAYVFMGSNPEFRIENFSLNPKEVPKGHPVKVEADVKNISDVEGTRAIEIQVEGETLSKEVTLRGGESKAVSFDVVKHVEGTYNLTLENHLTESFKVVDPDKFEVDNLSVKPSEVEPGDLVFVSVNVVNNADVAGSFPVELKVNGISEAGMTLDLESGESNRITFELIRNVPDNYLVSIGNLTDSFRVVENTN